MNDTVRILVLVNIGMRGGGLQKNQDEKQGDQFSRQQADFYICLANHGLIIPEGCLKFKRKIACWVKGCCTKTL
jgi:hypothetical protein